MSNKWRKNSAGTKKTEYFVSTQTLVMKLFILNFKKVVFGFLLSFFFLPSFSQTYSSYNDLAKEALDNKNNELCIEYCTKSINIQPNGWAYWERGIAKYNTSKFNEAAEDYTSAMQYYSDNLSLAGLYCNRGDSYYSDLKYKLAIDDYTKAFSYNYSDNGKLYRFRGGAYFFNGNYDEAEADYSNAITYFSTDPKTLSDIYYFRGQCENYQKKEEAALADFNKAIDTDPGNAQGYEQRALIWGNRKNYNKAIEDETKAIAYQKTQLLSKIFIAEDYNERAGYYYLQGNYEQAIKDAELSQATDSIIGTGWWQMGLYQYAGGYYKKAIESYKKEIASRKDTFAIASLFMNISLCYGGMLDYRSAIKEVNKAIDLKINFGKGYWTRAKFFNSSKLYKNALNDYDKAILLLAEDKKSLSAIYKERGELYFNKLKDIDKAAYNFSKALTLNPDDENTLYEYGRFMVQSKKNIEDGEAKLKICAEKDFAADTSSTYSYAKFFLGEKEEAFNNMFRLLDKYRFDKYEFKWELHVVACLYALSGNPTKAIEYQEESFKEGFYDFNHLLNDKDLTAIQNLPAYKALLVKYKMPVPKYFIK